MSKWWLVARHEFLTNIKRRSFLFAAFGAPLFTVGLMVIVFGVIGQSFTGNVTQPIGYVDQSGVLAQGVQRPETFSAYENEEAARAALDAGAVNAYFVVPENYLASGDVTLYRGDDVPPAVEDMIDAYLLANLSAGLGRPEEARLIADAVDLSVKTLDNGRVIRDEGIIGVFMAPLIFVLIFMIAAQTTSGYLMSSVVEEKSNRIMEVLVTSVTPLQLLAGKIIGLGALGLLQLLIWLAAGGLILLFNRDTPVLSGVSLPLDLVIVAVIFFLLDYFLYGGIMAGVGAATGSEQESRQIAGVFGFVLAIPFFALVTLFENPDGPLSVFLTLFPLTSPIWVILRMSLAYVPTWQLLLSVVIMLVTTVGVVWISARVFRWTLLMYGKRLSLRMIGQALRPGARMQTTATGEAVG